MSGSNVTDKMTKDGEKLLNELKELASLEVAIGFQEGLQYPDGTEVVDVAMWNELGTEHSPSRPFLRQSIDNNEDKIQAFMKSQMMGMITNSKTAEEVLKQTGVFQKGIIQEEIRNGTFEPNADSTIRAKGSSKPLIDTGLMRQSVNYQVRKKKG